MGCVMKEYVSISKLNEVWREHRHIMPKVPVSAYREQFYKVKDCYVEKRGHPFDKKKQRHTLFVNKNELAMRVYKDWFS